MKYKMRKNTEKSGKNIGAYGESITVRLLRPRSDLRSTRAAVSQHRPAAYGPQQCAQGQPYEPHVEHPLRVHTVRLRRPQRNGDRRFLHGQALRRGPRLQGGASHLEQVAQGTLQGLRLEATQR